MNRAARASGRGSIMILVGLMVLFCAFLASAPTSLAFPFVPPAPPCAPGPVLAPWQAPALEALPPKHSAEEVLTLSGPWAVLAGAALCLFCLAMARLCNGARSCAPLLPEWVALWEHRTDGRKKYASFE